MPADRGCEGLDADSGRLTEVARRSTIRLLELANRQASSERQEVNHGVGPRHPVTGAVDASVLQDRPAHVRPGADTAGPVGAPASADAGHRSRVRIDRVVHERRRLAQRPAQHAGGCLQRAPYWMGIRHAVGVRAGVPAEKLADILRYRNDPRFTPREQAALAFCEQVIRGSQRVQRVLRAAGGVFHRSAARRADVHHPLPRLSESVRQGLLTMAARLLRRLTSAVELGPAS